MKIWKTKLVKVKELLPNESNPRTITTEKIQKLQKQFESVGFYNPPKVDNKGILLGGNQRFRALMDAGYGDLEIPVMYPTKKLTKKQREEVIITDNVSDGEWDWDLLANDFELPDLEEWGLELPRMGEEENDDSKLPDDEPKKHILQIECESEAEQEILYNRFLGEKLKVKII